MLIDDQLGLANVNVFGQGNLEFGQGKVSEKSEFYILKLMGTLSEFGFCSDNILKMNGQNFNKILYTH